MIGQCLSIINLLIKLKVMKMASWINILFIDKMGLLFITLEGNELK